MSYAKSILPLCLVLSLGSALAMAADTGNTKAAATVAKLDKDNDKTLDIKEVSAAAEARFKALEKDSDGTLDKKEVKGLIGAAAFKSADPDSDGTLSKYEYLNLIKKLFDQADVDHDGTLDAKELASKPGRQLRKLLG